MPAKKATPRALEARRETRKALMEALRAIREAKKSIVKTGRFGPLTVDPIIHPPQPPNTVCRLSISKVTPVYPPHVPTFICRILRYPPHVPAAICHLPPVPKGVTAKDFNVGLYVIEFWLRYLLKVFDRLYPKQPARPKPKSRR